MLNTVLLPEDLSDKSLMVSAPDDLDLIKVIHMLPGQIVTGSLEMTPLVVDGKIVSDIEQDVVKAAVIERHHGTGNIGLAFVHGFGITNGALASTVGHDAHNLAVVGTNDADMICAAKALATTQGGQCVVQDGRVLAVVPLAMAGLISVESTVALVESRRLLAQACDQIGCTLPDPTMALSFMPLSVIPHLKVSDQGLIDVDQFQIVGIAR
jgi:adenine deaminase